MRKLVLTLVLGLSLFGGLVLADTQNDVVGSFLVVQTETGAQILPLPVELPAELVDAIIIAGAGEADFAFFRLGNEESDTVSALLNIQTRSGQSYSVPIEVTMDFFGTSSAGFVDPELSFCVECTGCTSCGSGCIRCSECHPIRCPLLN